MPKSGKDAPPPGRMWRLGADVASRRELFALRAARYRLRGKRLLRRLTNRNAALIELSLADSPGDTPIHLTLRRRDGGDHASFFENFVEIPYGLEELGPVRLAVDAGAHVGCFSLALHRAFPEAEIVAFEPDAANLRLLTRNWEANAIRGCIVGKALWTEETECAFRVGKSNSGRIASTSADFDEERVARRVSETVRVETTTLAEQLGDRVGEVDLLKLDIEGAELDVLENVLPLLGPDARILCELHDSDLNRGRFESLLAEHGWDGERIDETHPHSYWFVRRNR